MPRRRVQLIVLLLSCAWSAPAAGEGLSVIVHPERQESLGLDELGQIYLKKRRFWSDGTAIVPVNREAGSDVRSAFEHAVFGAERRRLSAYWNREYFRGVLPPATLASDAAVKRFIASERRAIGYLRSGQVDDSVRLLLTLDVGAAGIASCRGPGGAWWPLPVMGEQVACRSTAVGRGVPSCCEVAPRRAGAGGRGFRRPRATVGIGALLPEPALGRALGTASRD